MDHFCKWAGLAWQPGPFDTLNVDRYEGIKAKQVRRRKASEKKMEESIEGSLVAPIIFLIVVAVQYFSRCVQLNTSRVAVNAEELKLRAEIKQLLKEANAMSQPSTFAQAAKIRRTAAAKEHELAKNHEKLMKELKSSYDTHSKALMVIKILTYFLLIIWFWSIPVASIPKQLFQPFGGSHSMVDIVH
ncbi:hypothetical protein CQW23_03560 [Capsicum baccatum]|uniref:Uncharacterized protein n=1 Tax=Capsicum baccatum TaxID=33114 RepID=A0A2G2XC57_CAPBA|nr:hypothetical protein CQW23_03560 [Capsicum baccatum]